MPPISLVPADMLHTLVVLCFMQLVRRLSADLHILPVCPPPARRPTKNSDLPHLPPHRRFCDIQPLLPFMEKQDSKEENEISKLERMTPKTEKGTEPDRDGNEQAREDGPRNLERRAVYRWAARGLTSTAILLVCGSIEAAFATPFPWDPSQPIACCRTTS